MLKISKAIVKSKEMLGKTVEYCRKDILDEGANILKRNPYKELITFGVKNTNQIQIDVVEKIKENDYLFHTIDKMSTNGRAIDIDVINPLTGRSMTGSSSGGCINILLGINDFALGNDGGGSVLAPAISTGLFSVMAKGLGLKGSKKRQSTDGIEFFPGLGVISHDLNICVNVLSLLSDVKIYSKEEIKNKKIKVAIPNKHSETLPNDGNVTNYLDTIVKELKEIVTIEEFHLKDYTSRKSMIEQCTDIFDKGTDVIIAVEGPIDIYGFGDSVLGTHGYTGKRLQDKGGKKLLKIVNMINATGVTIPTNNLATGILIIGKEGIESGNLALSIGSILKNIFQRSPLFDRYLVKSYKNEYGGFI